MLTQLYADLVKLVPVYWRKTHPEYFPVKQCDLNYLTVKVFVVCFMQSSLMYSQYIGRI